MLYLKGTVYGTNTDKEGLYHLKAPAGKYTLVVSAVGYERQPTMKKLFRKIHLCLSVPFGIFITLNGTAGVVPAGRLSLRAADLYGFDPDNGEIIWTKPYSEQDKATKVRSSIYMLHVGSWGGLITRILTFLAALIGATLPLTGYYLWIRRLLNRRKHR